MKDEKYDRSTIPPFRGDARRAGGYQNYFLEQPRRVKSSVGVRMRAMIRWYDDTMMR